MGFFQKLWAGIKTGVSKVAGFIGKIAPIVSQVAQFIPKYGPAISGIASAVGGVANAITGGGGTQAVSDAAQGTPLQKVVDTATNVYRVVDGAIGGGGGRHTQGGGGQAQVQSSPQPIM
jgi:phage-related protein